MDAAILNIEWGFIKIKIRFINVVILVKVVYFEGNDCLSLELKEYKKKKKKCSKIIIKNRGDLPAHITKTCLYNFDPLKPHFYVVKLEFTGVYIIFLISA